MHGFGHRSDFITIACGGGGGCGIAPGHGLVHCDIRSPRLWYGVSDKFGAIYNGRIVKAILCKRFGFRDVLSAHDLTSVVTVRAAAYWLATLMCMCVIVLPGYAVSDGCKASPGPLAVLPSSQTPSPVMVMGFLGGFVPHDEPHHPEVQLIRDLRQEYPQQIYFGLFENNKVGEAYSTILTRLGGTARGELSDNQKCGARIFLFGHSWGASALVSLSRKLAREGIPVILTVQVDSVTKPFQNDRVIPPNVLQAANFYQTSGLIHGTSRITAADPSRTTILGNFRSEYKAEPKACRDFSWYARFFTRSHIEIECDPQVWLQVKTLLRAGLPTPLATRTKLGEPFPAALGKEVEAIQKR